MINYDNGTDEINSDIGSYTDPEYCPPIVYHRKLPGIGAFNVPVDMDFTGGKYIVLIIMNKSHTSALFDIVALIIDH